MAIGGEGATRLPWVLSAMGGHESYLPWVVMSLICLRWPWVLSALGGSESYLPWVALSLICRGWPWVLSAMGGHEFYLPWVALSFICLGWPWFTVSVNKPNHLLGVIAFSGYLLPWIVISAIKWLSVEWRKLTPWVTLLVSNFGHNGWDRSQLQPPLLNLKNVLIKYLFSEMQS